MFRLTSDGDGLIPRAIVDIDNPPCTCALRSGRARRWPPQCFWHCDKLSAGSRWARGMSDARVCVALTSACMRAANCAYSAAVFRQGGASACTTWAR